MAAKTPAFEEKIRRAIRDAMALDPIMTHGALMTHLRERFDHSFESRYIRRLSIKVMGQARSEIDRAKIAERLSSLRETHRIARERLLSVLAWQPGVASSVPKPAARDVVEAAKNLVMLDIAVLNAEVANGLYKPAEDATAIALPAPLPPAHRDLVLAALARFGILPENAAVPTAAIMLPPLEAEGTATVPAGTAKVDNILPTTIYGDAGTGTVAA